MANNKLHPHRSINYRCSQFPKIPKIAALFVHLNLFYLEIRLDCQM